MSASVLQTTLAEARAVPASAVELVVLCVVGGHGGRVYRGLAWGTPGREE